MRRAYRRVGERGLASAAGASAHPLGGTVKHSCDVCRDRARSYAALKLHKKAFDRENLRWSREDENRLHHWRLSDRSPTTDRRLQRD